MKIFRPDYGITLLILATFFLQTACKKNTTQNIPATYEVEYKIVPFSNAITKFTYIDQTGASVVLKDTALPANGIKKITVSTKPFTASLTTEMNNQTSSPISYNLFISIDGVQKISVPGKAQAATASTVSSVYYSVQ